MKADCPLPRVFWPKISRAPLGGVPKSELDYKIFVALIRSGYIHVDAPVFETAQLLQVTPAKVNALTYSYRMRIQTEQGLLAELAAAIVVVAHAIERQCCFHFEDRFWRDTLIAHLKRAHVYTDTSFNRERVTVSSEKFVNVLESVFPDNAPDSGLLLKRPESEAEKPIWFPQLEPYLARP